MADTNLTEADEGKRVISSEGHEVGRISQFRGGRAYVDPDPDLSDTIMSKLGWSEADADDYPLDESKVQTVTDDEVRLHE